MSGTASAIISDPNLIFFVDSYVILHRANLEGVVVTSKELETMIKMLENEVELSQLKEAIEAAETRQRELKQLLNTTVEPATVVESTIVAFPNNDADATPSKPPTHTASRKRMFSTTSSLGSDEDEEVEDVQSPRTPDAKTKTENLVRKKVNKVISSSPVLQAIQSPSDIDCATNTSAPRSKKSRKMI